MDFEPQTEEEIRDSMVLPAGIYDFLVVKATEQISKAGNAMIALELRVFESDGSSHYVRDWLVASDAGLSKMKLCHFCRATGLEANYEQGSLTDDLCAGTSGRVKTEVEDSEFGLQARVRDYLAPAAEAPRKEMPVNPNPPRDNEGEVPF